MTCQSHWTWNEVEKSGIDKKAEEWDIAEVGEGDRESLFCP
jgi:hypothetical protein